MTDAERLKYPPPPVPGWLQKYRPEVYPEFQIEFNKPTGRAADPWELHWRSNIGPQTWTLLCPFDEILIGGRRGGSKSAALIAWFAMGDLSLSPDDPARASYLMEPSFRGLMLRKEYQSMADFVDEAMEFFRPFKVKAKDDPVVFHFNTDKTGKSGAKIYTNHLGDKEAYEKYRGHGITKIGIEELTQIPEENWYLRLFGSLRNKKQFRIHNGRTMPALRTQIMSTTNPGGPGAHWVKKRFVKVYDEQGRQIPWNNPMRSPAGSRRIFIPMRLADNPYLRDNKEYESKLLEQDEITRKQWMDGDWDAGVGAYFSTFRPDGPVTDDERTRMPWARHVVEPCHLQPWWFRCGGGDWGYDHPAVWYKGCRNGKDGRLHIYDELVLRETGSFETGVILAKWWLPDLEYLPDKQIVIALSPDAFSKTDASRTKADQIADGIQQVLGPYGAFLLRYNDDERLAAARDPQAAGRMFERRRHDMARGQLCIALKSANTDRIAGWQYLREMLRFRPVVSETEDELKARLMATFHRAGLEAYERELARVKVRETEVLPKMVLWPCCRELRRFFEEAMTDEPPRSEDVRKWDARDGVGGDDPGDALRHLAMMYRDVSATMPKSYYVGEKVTEAKEQHLADFGTELTDPTRLAMISATQAANYARQNPVGMRGVTFPRAGSQRHRTH